MNALETRQADLVIRIEEAKHQSSAPTVPMERIKNYLTQYADITTKSPEMQKRIIQAFVQKVIVFSDDTVEIVTSVDFDG
jgi:site-specific DNA recombinase